METPPRNDLRDYQRRARRVAGRGANRPERPFRERKLVAGVSQAGVRAARCVDTGRFPRQFPRALSPHYYRF